MFVWGERGWTCLGNRKIRFIRTGTVAQTPPRPIGQHYPSTCTDLCAPHRMQWVRLPVHPSVLSATALHPFRQAKNALSLRDKNWGFGARAGSSRVFAVRISQLTPKKKFTRKKKIEPSAMRNRSSTQALAPRHATPRHTLWASHPLAVFWQLSRPSGWCKARWARSEMCAKSRDEGVVFNYSSTVDLSIHTTTTRLPVAHPLGWAWHGTALAWPSQTSL
jgi:hypothetical protein